MARALHDITLARAWQSECCSPFYGSPLRSLSESEEKNPVPVRKTRTTITFGNIDHVTARDRSFHALVP